MSSFDLYEAHTLPKQSRSIRVLDLEPAVNHDAPIRCRLRVVNLADSPKFVALSYVWGTSSTVPRTVSCGLYTITVTDNCWDALWHLQRDPDRRDPGRNEDGSITLWIDAICINQIDRKEVLSQITVMRDIYAQAGSVCIWLGKGDERADKAMSYLETAGFQDMMVAHGQHTYKAGSLLDLRVALHVTIGRYMELFRNGLMSTEFRKKTQTSLRLPDQFISDYTVLDVLGRPWIRRIWTFQEVVLAKNPWIRCGTERVRWRNFIHSVTFISSCGIWNEDCSRWISLVKIWTDIHFNDNAIPRESETTIEDEKLPPASLSSLSDAKAAFDAYKDTLTWAVVFPIRFNIFYAFAIHGGLVASAVTWRLRGQTVSLVFNVVLAILCFIYWILFLSVYFTCNLAFNWRTFQGDSRASIIPNPVRAVVQEIRRRDCFMPKDKSLGVNAVLSRLGVDLPIHPDSVSKEDLYKELFLGVLQGGGSLNLLLCASEPGVPDQPSWVPDWTVNDKASWLNPNYLSFTPKDAQFDKNEETARPPTGWTRHLIPTKFWPVWGDCTPASRPTWEISENQQTLTVVGKAAGRIIWVGEDFRQTSETFDDAETAIHEHNICVLQSLLAEHPTRSTLRCQFDMIVSKGIKPADYIFSKDMSVEMTNSSLSDTKAFLKWYALLRRLCRYSKANILSALRSNRKTLQYHLQICNSLASRHRTLAAATGEHIGATYGNCPSGTRIGDHVVLVSGVSLPLVLRQQDGAALWRLVGFGEFESDSLMRGLAWWELRQGGLERISIR